MKINKTDELKYSKPIVQSKNEVKKSEPSSNNKIKEMPNVYYKPLSFGRTVKEHNSWGARINPDTKEVSFKVLTYPDTERVEVVVQKKDNPKNVKIYELENKGEGIFETPKLIKAGEVESGDTYFYKLYKPNGVIDCVKDPYSFRQEQLLDKSTVYDHSLYQWHDDGWYSDNKNRISRKADGNNKLKSVDSARIFEFNTASLTKKGTFDSAMNVIKLLPELGFNAIEIMPVENTYSYNWGYDGVDKMAPSEHLGGPDGLKKLIDFAHNNGINVIMDIVPNHLGPDGASLRRTGPFISGSNDFGEAFNFEGDNSKYVRDFIVNSALNWIQNYHCDGLRLDMTKYMMSDYTMKQIAAEVNYHCPDAFLIAEDGRSSMAANSDGFYWNDYNEPHDKRVINPLIPDEYGEGKSEDIHNGLIDDIQNGNTSLGRLGYDSEWDFNYFHSLKDALYGVVNMDDFEKACYCSQDRVKYVMSHDEIGNFEGSRLLAKLLVPMLHLNNNVILDNNDIKRAKLFAEMKNVSEEQALNTITLQKAQFTAEKLAIMLQNGTLDRYDTNGSTSREWTNAINKAFVHDILRPLGIKSSSHITLNYIKSMYTRSFNRNKMAVARTFSIPGPKMIFQGDESADLTPFRFFRQFESVKREDNLYIEKGYEPGKSALDSSVFGNIKYSNSAKNMMRRFRNLVRDLNNINEENSALVKGRLVPENTIKHSSPQVFASHAADYENNNEIFSITNFAPYNYPRDNADEYYIKFPKGKWVEILNTDDRKYGGSGRFMNSSTIDSDGNINSSIKMAGESTLIFKKVG